jgi:hypothetical protein
MQKTASQIGDEVLHKLSAEEDTGHPYLSNVPYTAGLGAGMGHFLTDPGIAQGLGGEGIWGKILAKPGLAKALGIGGGALAGAGLGALFATPGHLMQEAQFGEDKPVLPGGAAAALGAGVGGGLGGFGGVELARRAFPKEVAALSENPGFGGHMAGYGRNLLRIGLPALAGGALGYGVGRLFE